MPITLVALPKSYADIRSKAEEAALQKEWRFAVDVERDAPADLTDRQIAVLALFSSDDPAIKTSRLERKRSESKHKVSVTLEPRIRDLERQVGSCLRHIEQLEGAASDQTKETRLKAVEARVTGLERRPTMRYCGVWDKAAEYPAESLTTYGGSMWHTETGSRGEKPGAGPTGWKLVVKRGSDGPRGPKGDPA
jgi:hypothetical protein